MFSEHCSILRNLFYLIVTADDFGNSAITPGRVIRMRFIDSAHDKKILVRDNLPLRSIPIDAAAVDAQKIRLTADVDF